MAYTRRSLGGIQTGTASGETIGNSRKACQTIQRRIEWNTVCSKDWMPVEAGTQERICFRFGMPCKISGMGKDGYISEGMEKIAE
jgi:hypothetical protein